MFIIYIADKNLYVESVSAFTSNRDNALRIPTQVVADGWVDYMAEHFYPGATWRVVPVRETTHDLTQPEYRGESDCRGSARDQGFI